MTGSAMGLYRLLVLTGLFAGAATAQEASIVALEQFGEQNSATIVQDGEDVTTRLRIDGTGNLDGRIEQTGAEQSSEIRILGNSNIFEVSQIGDSPNTWASDIQGDNNLVIVDQINTGFGFEENLTVLSVTGNANSALVSQGPGGELGSGGNFASLIQSGDGLTGEIIQSGSGNSAILNQTGSDIRGSIVQEGSGLSAELNQEGAGLDYAITQTGCVVSGGCPTIIVNQTGGGAVVVGGAN